MAFSILDNDSENSKIISVSEVATRHIRRLASSASDFLGYKVNAAVITVPTDFSDEQKSALSAAAKQADVEVLQYISEPVAAVLAYDARPEAKTEDKIIVVADFGGIRSDIAVIASRGGIYSILSTMHDYESGGRQMDEVLIDHFAKEFLKKHKSDPRRNPRSLAKLKLEAEATKKALSLGATASLSVESLAEGIDFSSTINRTRYEILASKVFAGFVRLVQEAVQKADLDVIDIDEVSHPQLSSFLFLGKIVSERLTDSNLTRSFYPAEHLIPHALRLSSPHSFPLAHPSSHHRPHLHLFHLPHWPPVVPPSKHP